MRIDPPAPALVCRWAAALLLAPPDAAALAAYREPEAGAFLAGMRADADLAAPAEVIAALVAPLADLAVSADLLARAHAAAFLIGGRQGAAPYASVWLSPRGLLFQEPARAMQRLLTDAGLGLAEDLREPPDHLAVELNFLAELLAREASGEPLPITPQAFVHDHILTWLPRFADACGGLRNPLFYPDLAQALAAWLARILPPETRA